MPDKFVHFCGASGVGKSTLIKKLIDNTPPRLRERFGLESRFQSYGDGHGSRNSMDLFFANDSTIVHNWQYITHGYIAHFERAYPEAEHRIYLLWRPWADVLRALNSRPGNKETMGDVVRAWQEIVARFRQLEGWGFNVEVVNASTEDHDQTTFETIDNTLPS